MVVVQMRVVLLVDQLGVVQMAPQSNWGKSNQGQSNWGQSKWGQTHILVWKGLPLFGQSPISFETCCFLGVILVPLVICSFSYGGLKNCSEYRNSTREYTSVSCTVLQLAAPAPGAAHLNQHQELLLSCLRVCIRAGPQTPKCQKCYGTNFFHCVYTYK